MSSPFRSLALAAALVLACAAGAHAATVNYNFAIDAPNGYAITGLSLYATDGVSDDLYLSPAVIGPSGTYQLSHTVGFTPTAAIVIGVTDRDQDNNFDLVMFVNQAFVPAHLGQLYRDVFPSANGNLGHNTLGFTIEAAHAGDATALAALLAHIRGADVAELYFNPFGSYDIVQFTAVAPPIGGDIPSPASASVITIALASLALRRRRVG